jgi:hypothetical protein
MVKDEVGQRYGRLLVVERNGSKDGRAVWLCRCDCSKESTVMGKMLRRGETRSCGCANTRHGQARHGGVSITYNTYRAMVKRCEYPLHHNFKSYGGRVDNPIRVCERWPWA